MSSPRSAADAVVRLKAEHHVLTAFPILLASSVVRRELAQRVAGDAEDRPRVHRRRAEPFIEPDRRLVPVEHRPLEAPAAPFDRERREMLQQRLAVAAAAMLGNDEEILEIE